MGYSGEAGCWGSQDARRALVQRVCVARVERGAGDSAGPLASLARPHGVQAPKLKTVLAHSSSGEGSKKRRRFCPFRVRFADETLRDSALRYWERALAGKQTAGGAPGLQKVPAWSPESRGRGPGSWE